MSSLKILISILYFSILATSLPHNRNHIQSPLSSSPSLPKGYPGSSGEIVCKGDQLQCGNVCYYPIEADCDPQFLSLTKFGPHITGLRKAALEGKKKGKKKNVAPSSGASNPVAKAASPTSMKSREQFEKNL